MKIYYILAFLILWSLKVDAQIQISGIIVNVETKEPVEFANIGIANANRGTVSNEEGKFKLEITKELSGESITISHINYYPEKIPVKNLESGTIHLRPRTNELAEVVVFPGKKRQRKIGVKSYNPLLWLRASSQASDIIENAQRINIPNKLVRVNLVNLYLREGFQTDSSYIRINFYRNVNDTPGEKIFFENLVQKKKITPGWIQMNLRENYVYLKEDFFVGVEFLPDFKNPKEVYLGAILTKGKGYSRNSSQGSWKKLQGASTINVEIEF